MREAALLSFLVLHVCVLVTLGTFLSYRLGGCETRPAWNATSDIAKACAWALGVTVWLTFGAVYLWRIVCAIWGSPLQ